MEGNKNTFPGAVDMTNTEYHSETGHISKSGLTLIKRSPAHYYARYLDPQREPAEQTPAMIIGSAVHMAVFEPDIFNEHYVTVPDDAPRKPSSTQRNAKNPSADTLYAIEWWDSFNAENAGKTILSADDYVKCMRIRDAVWQHRIARTLLKEGGYFEQSFFFNEPNTGAPCKVRPDFIAAKRQLIVDLKTTEDAGTKAFGQSSFKYGYHIQAPFYLDGVLAASGVEQKQFVFIVVEKEPPYAVAVYYADDDMLALGRQEYLNACAMYADCLRTGKWPAYPEKVTPVALPAWAYPKQHNNYDLI